MEGEMIIKYGQPVTVTIKRVKTKDGEIVMNGAFPVVEEITIKGTVSGIFQPDWCSIYGNDNHHAVIDLRAK